VYKQLIAAELRFVVGSIVFSVVPGSIRGIFESWCNRIWWSLHCMDTLPGICCSALHAAAACCSAAAATLRWQMLIVFQRLPAASSTIKVSTKVIAISLFAAKVAVSLK
jgi:hypothetical protein